MEYIKDTCVQCGTKEEIVHSGTDGILLGVLNELHHICYPCANKHYMESIDEKIEDILGEEE